MKQSHYKLRLHQAAFPTTSGFSEVCRLNYINTPYRTIFSLFLSNFSKILPLTLELDLILKFLKTSASKIPFLRCSVAITNTQNLLKFSAIDDLDICCIFQTSARLPASDVLKNTPTFYDLPIYCIRSQFFPLLFPSFEQRMSLRLPCWIFFGLVLQQSTPVWNAHLF